MAYLAIKGHEFRGKEVIEILEMLGGRNKYLHCGESESYFFFIQDGIIDCDEVRYVDDHTIYTIEEFLEKFPYKIGDKVIYTDKIREITKMVWEEQTNTVAYKLDDKLYCNVINKLKPYKEETMKEIIIDTIKENEDRYRIHVNYQFEIKVDEGEYYVVRRKPQYPKTYEECCKVLNICPNGDIVYAGNWVYGGEYLEKHLERIRNFQKLLICRDAYWKIEGEQMGLGKPWEPDYTNDDVKFCVCCCSNLVVDGITYDTTEVFVFPTAEMRGAFRENFKDLIEQCKELL